MRYQDVHVGCEYRHSGYSWLGRCVITGSGVKNRLTGRYGFPVAFPDARPTHNKPERADAADLTGPWTRKDQEQWEKDVKESAQLQAIELGLIAADFEPAWVRTKPGTRETPGPLLWIAFEGDTAERVVKALLESVELKNEVLELELNGPHDEE